MKLRLFKLVSCLVLITISKPSYAFIDPGTVAMLSAIAASAKETAGTLKNTMDLIEVSNEMKKTISNQEDDFDALSELFEEVSPDGRLTQTERDSNNSFKDYQNRISSVDEKLSEVDGIKWEVNYLKMRSDKMNPKRLSSLVRTATRATRIGKRLARLLPKSHEEQVATNTELMKEQNYAIGKTMLDIRTELRAMNERQAKNSVDGTINTVNAIEQLQDDDEASKRPML